MCAAAGAFEGVCRMRAFAKVRELLSIEEDMKLGPSRGHVACEVSCAKGDACCLPWLGDAMTVLACLGHATPTLHDRWPASWCPIPTLCEDPVWSSLRTQKLNRSTDRWWVGGVPLARGRARAAYNERAYALRETLLEASLTSTGRSYRATLKSYIPSRPPPQFWFRVGQHAVSVETRSR